MRFHYATTGLAAACTLLLAGCANLLPPPTGPQARLRNPNAVLYSAVRLRAPIPEEIARLAPSRAGDTPTTAVAMSAPVTTPVAERSVTAAAAREVVVAPVSPNTSIASAGPASQSNTFARDDAPPAWGEVQQTVEAWRKAWEAGDANAYLRQYDAAYRGDAVSRADWERQRKQRLANGQIKLQLERVQLVRVSDDEAAVSFVQHYTSGKHHDTGTKQLVLKRRGPQWRIVDERWSAGGA